MKVALCADVHIGNRRAFGGRTVAGVNDRCRSTIEVLYWAAKVAAEAGARDFVVAGDLFDKAHPEPQVIAAVADMMHECGERYGTRWVLVPGNHDQSSERPGDHALSALDHPSRVCVRVVDDICAEPLSYGEVELVVVPPKREGYDYHKLADELPEPNGHRLVVGHHGLYDPDEANPDWVTKKPAASYREVDGFCSQVFAHAAYYGDWHRYRSFPKSKRPVVQLGTLCPGSWSDEYPGEQVGLVSLWDMKMAPQVLHVPGPRFVTVAPGVEPPHMEGTWLYVRVCGPQEDSDEWARELGKRAEVKGVVVQAETEHRGTAPAPRATPGTAEQAVYHYCAEQGLPDKVAKHSCALLGGALC